jgi:hypothetical protein
MMERWILFGICRCEWDVGEKDEVGEGEVLGEVYIPPVMTMLMIAWINVRISDRQQMLEDLTQEMKELLSSFKRNLS